MMNSPTRHIALLVNPKAGSGRGVLLAQQMVQRLQHRVVTVTCFDAVWPTEWTGFSDVWLVGGDGTYNFFMNRYPDCSLPVTLFAGGSGNDLYWFLYQQKSWEEVLEIGLSSSCKWIDVGMCNERYFLNGLGIGFDGAVAHHLMKKNKQLGSVSYWSAVLQQLIRYREKEFEVSSDNKVVSGKMLFLNFMNGSRSGGGFRVAPEAKVEDGKLEVIFAHPLKLWERFRYLPVIQQGRHLHLPVVDYFQTSAITVIAREAVAAHLDGEFFTAERFDIKVLPGKLCVRC